MKKRGKHVHHDHPTAKVSSVRDKELLSLVRQEGELVRMGSIELGMFLFAVHFASDYCVVWDLKCKLFVF